MLSQDCKRGQRYSNHVKNYNSLFRKGKSNWRSPRLPDGGKQLP